MISNKPYLLRAFFEWIIDSQCTPLLTLNANHPRCIVPKNLIEDGEITLNISPEAVRDLKITNKHVEFRASFSGSVTLISAPMNAVQAIYAHENGEGMYFEFEEINDMDEDSAIVDKQVSTTSSKKNTSHLTVIK